MNMERKGDYYVCGRVRKRRCGWRWKGKQSAVNNMIGLKETLMRIIHSKSLFYWLILKVFDILMANSLFVYETAD